MGNNKIQKRKRKSSSSSCSSSSSNSDKERRTLRALKKKLKKEQIKTEKILKKKLKEARKQLKKHKRKSRSCDADSDNRKKICKTEDSSTDIPLELMEKSRTLAPMTKEEWEKKQSVVRRVLDEDTGRYRLIKGDGEVLEEIVSRDRHKEINRQATRADGNFFQMQTKTSHLT